MASHKDPQVAYTYRRSNDPDVDPHDHPVQQVVNRGDAVTLGLADLYCRSEPAVLEPLEIAGKQIIILEVKSALSDHWILWSLKTGGLSRHND